MPGRAFGVRNEVQGGAFGALQCIARFARDSSRRQRVAYKAKNWGHLRLRRDETGAGVEDSLLCLGEIRAVRQRGTQLHEYLAGLTKDLSGAGSVIRSYLVQRLFRYVAGTNISTIHLRPRIFA